MPKKPITMAELRRGSGTNTVADNRGSACKCGYDRNWRKSRKAVVDEAVLDAAREEMAVCVDCRKAGKRFEIPRQGFELHHKLKVDKYPHLRLERDNVMVLCRSHHSRRTQRGE